MRALIAGALTCLLATSAFAQPTPGQQAASGNNNQAVATTSANAPEPARGANSFTAGEARNRIQSQGYQNVSGLKLDNQGVWRGQAMKNGQPVGVWLDYKGNVGTAS